METKHVGHYSRKELHELVEELVTEIQELREQNGALKLDLASQKTLHKLKLEEISGLVEDRDRFLEKSHNYAKENDEHKKHLHAYKSALENEQGSRKNAEIKAGKFENACNRLVEILDDNGGIGRLKGWYWHTKREQPVYVDNISIDGMTGYALNLGSEDRFLGSVTDTFDYDYLIRIDRNLANPF